MRRLRVPSPGMVVALVALFFALGGSAFAIGQQTAAAQPRCAQGAVRGLAIVVGGGSIPNNIWSSTPSFFGRRFNCTGKGVQVKRVDAGTYDVMFAGNRADIAIATAGNQATAAVVRNPDGSFRVTLHSNEDNDHKLVRKDGTFQLIAV